jgi:hexosaminidase
MHFKSFVAIATLACSPVNALWPIPQEQSLGEDVLFIDHSLKVTYNGRQVRWDPNESLFSTSFPFFSYLNPIAEYSSEQQMPFNGLYTNPPGSRFESNQIVRAGVSRAFKGIFDQNFVPWMLNKPQSDFEPDTHGHKKYVKTLDIVQTTPDDETTFKPLAGELDESYNLTLNANGKATITAASSIGALYGLESFVQLFYKHSSGRHWYTPYAPVTLVDEPEFPHRGVLMDTARHWFTVDDIKKVIDAMSWNKLNRLHFHVTDSQSWPLEIPSLPRLAEKGAYAKGLSYSPADIASIYEYGIHRGVQVVMEIDMPGHIGVVDLAYEDLIVAYNIQPYQWYCAQPPCGAFRLNSTKVYDFLDTLFDDLLPRLAPYSAYFHTGGDELNRNDSMLDPDVRSNDTEVLAPLLQTFLDFAHGKVREYGLTPFVWEEMITDWEMDLGEDVVVQSWLGGGAVKDLAEAGHKVIDSNYNFWYLDCGRGAWLNFDNGGAWNQFYPFSDWCGPTKSWALVHSHNPRAGISEEAAKNVLGGEVAIWAETIDPANIDMVLWPRASAAGEALWSGRIDASGQNRSQLEAMPRLAEMRERMVARGVRAAPFTQLFCTQGTAEECEYQFV